MHLTSPLLAALLVLAPAAQALAYPVKPIRVIVHSPPGGGPDVVARILAERLAARLGQSIVVENRPGASGTLALAAVARSEPDGYTLGTISPPQTVAPAIVPRLAYDTARDLAPVAQTTRASMLLVVRPGSPLGSVPQVLAVARAQPGRLTYASAGNGTPQHLAAEAFKRATGVTIGHVPYKGASAAVSALLGEQIDLLFTSAVTVGAHVRSGRLQALAATGPSRMDAFPDVPTLAEQGLSAFDVRDWQGLVAPAHTPKPILQRLAAELAAVLGDARIVERLSGIGVEAVSDSDPTAFGALIQSELERWARVAREGGIRAD